jgi:hypothetical protein
MIKLAKTNRLILLAGKIFCTCLVAYAGGGYQLSDCAGLSQINWVSYNADKFSPTSPLPKANYWTFRHETFHALEMG